MLSTITRALVNDYGITTALALLLLALWFSGESRAFREWNQRGVLSAISTVFVANVLVKLLNLVYHRPRPFATHAMKLLFYRPSDSSFPSNGTVVAFSVAASVWPFNRTVGAVMYMLACLFGLARVCSGVHYPTDILGGMLLAMSVAYVITKRAGFLDRLWTLIIRRLRSLLLA